VLQFQPVVLFVGFLFSFSLAGVRAEFEAKKPLSNKIVCSLDPMGNTYEAAKLLIQNKIHRIPLIERAKDSTEQAVPKESVTGVITQFKILRFLSTNVRPIVSLAFFPPFFDRG